MLYVCVVCDVCCVVCIACCVVLYCLLCCLCCVVLLVVLFVSVVCPNACVVKFWLILVDFGWCCALSDPNYCVFPLLIAHISCHPGLQSWPPNPIQFQSQLVYRCDEAINTKYIKQYNTTQTTQQAIQTSQTTQQTTHTYNITAMNCKW